MDLPCRENRRIPALRLLEWREVELFRETLVNAGVVATVRWSRGVESDAACGQLRLRAAR